MSKIGRNEKCPCGSGKKYKKCHLLIPKPTQEEISCMVGEVNQSYFAQSAYLKEHGILVNYVNPVIFNGRRAWALGSRVYVNDNPNETFHEFVVLVLRDTLGKPWFDGESVKKEDEQHFLYRCFIQLNKWQQLNAKPENRTGDAWGARPDGWSKALLSVAFDVASLLHVGALNTELIERLRGFDSFQGVRYEIGVAAIFARLNFKISFIEARRHGPKHAEFVAKDVRTGVEIAVEAKSRHRQGILHTPGTSNEWELNKADVGKLYNQALQKEEIGKMPSIIFIDVNCPITDSETADVFNKKWKCDTKRILSKTPTPEDPDPCNAVVFTNFSYHYQKADIAKGGEHLLVMPLYTKFLIKNPSFYDNLHVALNNYGFVPMIEPRPN